MIIQSINGERKRADWRYVQDDYTGNKRIRSMASVSELIGIYLSVNYAMIDQMVPEPTISGR